MKTSGKSRRPYFRVLLLLLLLVIVPSIFLGFYSIFQLGVPSVEGEVAMRESLLRAGIVFSCVMAILFGGVITSGTIKREMALARMKDTFVSNVSHELKTPLATIKLLGEMLDNGKCSEEKCKEYYRTICVETDRLSRLVNNVLSFSRMQAGHLKHNPIMTNLDALVQTVVDTFALGVGPTGFTFRIELKTEQSDELEPVLLSGDEISQALINLLENAVKYSDEAHEIVVEIRQDSKKTTLSVIDQGLGIPDGEQRWIFDEFYRVDDKQAARRKGTGIGLALVRQIMKNHNGNVKVTSRWGEGSRFTLVLPRTV